MELSARAAAASRSRRAAQGLSACRLFNCHGSHLLAHLIALLQRRMSGDLTDIIYAARKHRIDQFTAFEAVHPALHSLLCARKGFRCVLCRCCKQIGFRKGVVRIEQRVGPAQLQRWCYSLVLPKKKSQRTRRPAPRTMPGAAAGRPFRAGHRTQTLRLPRQKPR